MPGEPAPPNPNLIYNLYLGAYKLLVGTKHEVKRLCECGLGETSFIQAHPWSGVLRPYTS